MKIKHILLTVATIIATGRYVQMLNCPAFYFSLPPVEGWDDTLE